MTTFKSFSTIAGIILATASLSASADQQIVDPYDEDSIPTFFYSTGNSSNMGETNMKVTEADSESAARNLTWPFDDPDYFDQ